MSRTKKTAEGSSRGSSRRAEQRLRYRWPVRFATNTNQKQPFSGQLVDVSSQGMALLFHAGKNCPRPDQLVTAGFGVPYFDSRGSFDTVFFNRVARVCRVDNLSSRVNRVAVQFTEPLFFKPGEQNVSEADAQQRLDVKTRSIAPASLRPEHQGTTASRAKTPQKARSKGGKGAKAEAAETEARRRARSCAEQISKVKAEVAGEIARITAEAAEAIARIEAQFDAEAVTGDQTHSGSPNRHGAVCDTDDSEDGGLMKKVDTFLTSRSTVF